MTNIILLLRHRIHSSIEIGLVLTLIGFSPLFALAAEAESRVTGVSHRVSETPIIEWNPYSINFPVDLGVAAITAQTYLIQRENITNQLDLTLIRLSGFQAQGNRMPHEGDGAFSRWTCTLGFQAQPNASNYYVQVFLSTSGDPNISLKTLPSRNADTTKELISSKSVNTLPKQQDPYARLHEADFPIPKIQWQPPQHFPLILNDSVTQARDQISKLKSVSQESLILVEVTISNYIPFEAIKSKNLDFFENTHHWLTVLRYQLQQGTYGLGYNVYMLLDGTVLAVNEYVEVNTATPTKAEAMP